MKKQPNNNNNVETRKDIEEETKRILLAEERDDPEQVIINITPDILQQLQEEYDEMKEAGYKGSYSDFSILKYVYLKKVAVLFQIIKLKVGSHEYYRRTI